MIYAIIISMTVHKQCPACLICTHCVHMCTHDNHTLIKGQKENSRKQNGYNYKRASLRSSHRCCSLVPHWNKFLKLPTTCVRMAAICLFTTWNRWLIYLNNIMDSRQTIHNYRTSDTIDSLFTHGSHIIVSMWGYIQNNVIDMVRYAIWHLHCAETYPTY